MKYVCRAGANIYHPEIFYTSHHDTKTGSYDKRYDKLKLVHCIK